MHTLTTIRLTAALFGLMPVLGGCNQPAVAPKPFAFQESANTVRDWNLVADKIATQIMQRGLSGSAAAVPATGSYVPRPIYVHVTSPNSTFLQEVAGRLRSDLLAGGGIVARSSIGATVVNLSVDVIQWGPRDKPPGGLGTLAGAVGVAGVLVGATGPFTKWEAARAGAWGAGAAGVLADAVTAITPTMNAEAVWQASVVSDDRVLLSLREPLYIRSPDIPLYYDGLQIAEISSPGAPLPVRRLYYDP